MLMNVTSFPLVQLNAYFLGIVILTKGIGVVILPIDIYVLLVMLHFQKYSLLRNATLSQSDLSFLEPSSPLFASTP